MKIFNINGEEYVKRNEIQEIIDLSGYKTLAIRLMGKNVLVRTRNAGINVGTVVVADETGIELINSRRLWYHRPKDKNLSWFEGVVVSGLSDDSKVSCTVPSKVIIEEYEAVLFENEEAFKSIMEKTPHAQS